MSEFSQAFDQTWDAAISVFGDKCVLMGVEYDCVIHAFDASTEVRRGAAGLSQIAEGSVIMRSTDWTDSGARKGVRIKLQGRDYRVTNDPEPGYTGSTVTLTVSPIA